MSNLLKLDGDYIDSTGIMHEGSLLNNVLNSIIESGSNAKGKYMKFGNGILVQYNSTKITDAAWQTITFPIAFVTDIPTVISTINTDSAESNRVAVAKQSHKTLTTFRGALVTPDGYGTGNIEWMAIGKWK